MSDEFADQLGWVAKSANLTASLKRAYSYAGHQRHRMVSVEYLLLALTEDADAADILAANRVDVNRLRNDVAGFIGRQNDRFGPGEAVVPRASGELSKIFEYASAAAEQSKRPQIDGAIVLAALIGEGRSPAAELLKSHGLTFENAVQTLQVRTPEAALPAGSERSGQAEVGERVARSGEAPRAPAPDQTPSIPSGGSEQPVPPRPVPQRKTVGNPARHQAKPALAPAASAAAARKRPVADDVLASVREMLDREDAGDELAELDIAPRDGTVGAPQAQPSRSEPPRVAARPDGRRVHPPQPEKAAPPRPVPGSGAPPNRGAPGRAMPGRESNAAAPPPLRPADAAKVDHAGLRRPGPPPAGLPPRGVPPSNPPPGGFGAPQRPHPPAGPPPQRTVSAPGDRPVFGGDAGGPRAPAPQCHGPVNASPPPQRPPRGGPAPRQGAPVDPRQGRGPPPPGGLDQAFESARPPTRDEAGAAASGAARTSARFEEGILVENIPRAMRVAVPEAIEVRIARSDIEVLAGGLEGRGTVQKHDVFVTRAMSVRLRAPHGGFWIETTSPETQWIEDNLGLLQDDFASWRWNVVPQMRGRAPLQLVISARTVAPDGMTAETALPDQVIEVGVRTNHKKNIKSLGVWALVALAGGMIGAWGQEVGGALSRILGFG